MDSISARGLIESSKEAAVTELVSKLEAAITERAKKGWNKAEVSGIVMDYNFPVINEVYTRMRTNGFSVNVLSHTLNW
jgi:hypothetical protein